MNWIRRPGAIDAGLLLLMSVVVTALWFNGNSLALGGDYGSVPVHPSQMAGEYLSSWNFWTDTGNALPMVIANQVPPIDFLFYLSAMALGLSAMAAEWAYVVLFSYFLGGYATYLLSRTLFHGKVSSIRLAGLAAGAFFILNPAYVYSTGVQSILGSSIPRSALPLALFLLVAGLKKKDLRYALALGLSALLLFAVFARAMEIAFFLAIAVALAIPYLPWLRRHLERLRFTARFLAVATVTAFAANLFWIVPFAENSAALFGKLSAYPASFVTFESQFTTLANVFRLQGYWTLFVGSYVPYASYYAQPPVLLVTFVLPIIVVGSLAWRLKWGLEKFSLALLLLLFMGLSLGANLPFHVYEGLIAWFPFFKLFKDPWVFLEPLSVVYSMLFGLSFEHFADFVGTRIGRPRSSKVASLAVALVILGTISAPVLTGAAYVNWYQPTQKGVTIPQSYQELNSWLEEQHCDCASLFVPELSGAYVATNWGFQGANTFYRNLISGRVITGSGSPVYGLQSAQSKIFTDYVYDMMSDGDPVYSPTPLNGTREIVNWTASSGSGPNLDSLVTASLTTPWNDTVLDWRIGSGPEQPSTGHSLRFQPNSTLNLSGQSWLDFWVSSTFGVAALDLGMQDQMGQTGWYALAGHVLMQSASWSLIALPLAMPDGYGYNQSEVSDVIIRTVIPTDGSATPLGNGTVSIGTLRLSTGAVRPDFVRFLLHAMNVGYVVLDTSINGSFYPALNPTPYAERLASLTNLVLIQRFGNLTVYVNDDAGSLISIPSTWLQLSNLYNLSAEFESNPQKAAAGGFVSGTGLRSLVMYSNAIVLGVERVGPTGFSIRVDAHGSFLLLLSTSYDSGWVATINGRQAGTHLLANGYANGWLVNETGAIIVQLQHGGQPALDASIAISLITVIATGIAAVLGTRRLRSASQMLRHWVQERRK